MIYRIIDLAQRIFFATFAIVIINPNLSFWNRILASACLGLMASIKSSEELMK